MRTRLVSVLLPVRDAETTLPACLASIRRQVGIDFECVVVDDGSRDRSAELAEAVAARDPRFRVLRRPARGIVDALNAGLARCRGSLVARMDADDLMHSTRLCRQAQVLDAHPQWAGLGCHVRLFPRSAVRDGLREYEAWLHAVDGAEAVRRERFIECPLPHPTWMLRRETFARFPYREVDWAEDYDLLLRVLDAGLELGVVAERLLLWREGAMRLWRRDPRYGLDRFGACRARFLAAGPLRDRSDYWLWGYGETGKALRRHLAAHDKTPSLIVELHPRRIGERIHGAPVVPPEALARCGPRAPLLVSVAGARARGEIRDELRAWGFVEGRDFFCAA